MNRVWPAVIIMALLTVGCATGRTEFKVIRQDPPQAPNRAGEHPQDSTGPAEAMPQTKVKGKKDNLPPQEVRLTVQPGDMLSALCLRVTGNARTYPRVAQANGIANPDLIFPGQVIVFSQAPQGANPAEAKTATPAQIKQPEAKGEPQTAQSSVAYPQIGQKAFAPGERLTFAVEYFGIAAGYATMKVEEGMDIENRPTYHLLATARTHPAFEWFFKVRDRIESYMDKEGLFSWRYEKHLREGGYKNDTVLEYRQLEKKVRTQDGKREVDAPAWTQDVLSEFYYFRALPLTPGKTITIPVLADDLKSYDLIVKVLGKEKITVPAGTFQCLKVEPFLKFEGLFKHQGQLYIWVTDDQRKVPVLIRSKIIIGSIDIVLRDAVVVDVE